MKILDKMKSKLASMSGGACTRNNTLSTYKTHRNGYYGEHVAPVDKNNDDTSSSSSSGDEKFSAGTKAPSWKPDKTFNVGDRVRYHGNTYVCSVAHLSTRATNPVSATSQWKMEETR
jgi:hypothetical protein